MIKTDGYSWSNKFNINTIGVPGVASMKRIYDEAPLDDNGELIEKYDTNVIEVGVIFSTLSSPFGKQKVRLFKISLV